jgi:hypothetical protein
VAENPRERHGSRAVARAAGQRTLSVDRAATPALREPARERKLAMDPSSELIDPVWFYISFGVMLAGVAAFMWWAGMLKRK